MVSTRGDDESLGIFQWDEDRSKGKLTARRGLEPVAKTERVNSNVIEKMKSLNYQREKGISV
jgi:hypothetical protein